MADFVGSRCDFEGHTGTIRYHGNVSSSTGVWFGVEWDEKRGKHNGTLEGIFYFECREQHGSFVRPHKVCLGISIIQALEKRYGTGCDNLLEADMFVLGENKQKTAVEMVGFEKVYEKQRQYQNLHKAGFIGMCISSVDAAEELENMAPNIRDLDVSRNLFSCWSQIADIAKQLNNLQILNLSGNKLKFPDSLESYCPAFKSVKTLFANRMELSWKKVSNILFIAANLTELHVCYNHIQHIENSLLENTKQLRLLNLEGNKIENWNEILKLSTLENLETLILNENLISKIEFPQPDVSRNVGFHSLQAISLNNNNISQWCSVNNLANLVSLKSVRFKANPICEGHKSLDLRQELIARLPRANAINGSKVTAQERQNAELDYLKKYSAKWHAAVGSAREADRVSLLRDFKDLHPSYEDLIKVYGEPLSNLDKKSKTLKEKLISLNFKCPDCSEKKTFTKKLPATMTIQQLKTLLQRLFKVTTYEQRLSYFDSKTDSEIEIDENLRDLGFYSISQNDTILVRW